jgi:hypothetical protein
LIAPRNGVANISRVSLEWQKAALLFSDNPNIPLNRQHLSTGHYITRTMASFEDYDEFGNYIGADLDSDDEENVSQQQQLHEEEPAAAAPAAPLEGFDDVTMETEDMALMEVDNGMRSLSYRAISILNTRYQNLHIGQLFSTRKSNTILRRRMYTVQTLRLLSKKKTRNLSQNQLLLQLK